MLLNLQHIKREYYIFFLVILSFVLFSFSPIKAQTISFGSSGLIGETVTNPTSLEFGPDDRLYVSQQNGTIWAYTIERDNAAIGSGTYSVTNSEEITIIRNSIKNHDDSGNITQALTRQITGIILSGTALNPIIYVTSSDNLIGGGGGGEDSNLDTNSGVLSKLEWDGNQWNKIDLIRGLPRCEENHSTNGMQLFERNGTRYMLLNQGGNTNKGAPSNNFAGTPEYFYSGSVHIIDLTQLESMMVYTDPRTNTDYVYDLPTLNDPSRADIDNTDPNFPYPIGHPMYNATIDIGDPFGGNNSLNQAFFEAGSPIQIFAPGFRNPYDTLITENGRIYLSDNGPNSGWGGLPKIYDVNTDTFLGDQSTVVGGYDPINHYVTNEINENGSSLHGDPLHFVGTINDSNGTYFGGHPLPINAFPSRAKIIAYENNGGTWNELYNTDLATLLVGCSGYFNSSFTVADFPDDPRLGEYLMDEPVGSTKVNILDIINASTNGIAEYTASNFNGAMQGNILTASFNGNINRYVLNASGDTVVEYEATFSGFGSIPLDVIAQGDSDIFPGTVWAATYGSDSITVFEPSDITCYQPGDPEYDEMADYDMDGFTNYDETENGTNICSQGSKPSDYDGDFISDLLDNDDDNDMILDVNDVFALDADNGLTTSLPISYPFWNNDPGTGILGLGFTGLMLDPSGSTNYYNQFSTNNLSFGGAAGKATVDIVTSGDALEANNNQDNGFQFGINVDSNSNPFTIHSKIESPFFGISGSQSNPVDFQSYGISIGNGDQDNYLKIVLMNGVTNADSEYGIQILLEDGGVVTHDSKYDITDILSANAINMYISVNPAGNTAQPFYSIDGGLTLNLLGSPITLPINFLDDSDNQGLAITLISTSRNSTEFTATWDFIEVYENQNGILTYNPNNLDFGLTPTTNSLRTKYVTLKNEGGPTDDVITVTDLNFTGTDSGLFSSDISLPFDINPGVSVLVPIHFISFASLGVKSANLEITHSGNNSPNSLQVSAELTDAFVPVVRINTGGNSVTATDGGPDWEANPAGDGGIGESFIVDEGGGTFSIGSIDYSSKDISIPGYIDQTTYEALMVSQRNSSSFTNNMIYHISVPNGDYIVNYYGANIYNGTSLPGQRVFSVNIEDERKIDHLDLSDQYGNEVAGMIQHNVTVTDNSLELEFIREIEAPVVNAIEILGLQYPIIQVDPISDMISFEGDYLDFTVVASGGNPADNFSYSISGQPDGIAIEPTNGLVSGTIQSTAVTGGPNSDGIHNVTITVSKPGSVPVEVEFLWTIKEYFDLNLDVSLQGRSDYSGTYSIIFYELNDLENPAYSFSETADEFGQIVLSSQVAESDYKLLVKHPQYLQELVNLNLINDDSIIVPELLAGDVNDDNKVNISDFAILAGSYNLESGDSEYDDRADLNSSGKVDISDFALLAGNYNIFGKTEND
ncbi:malectin domain-containing carbohydrate-binding protein [Yeosuana sp. MJ-SS3]|uniref:Malectin domain-containing carbohydrate-binding protein n=2 Tax=Gilvirhabdus luticola TaxID=3079858 RepID=A0ABU3U517_9FLAO|nr:malectin domain-containing carbohydrate-binding protein [Yeosuana sp. MJ-SS3]MDU8885505.1 malectin domain-containing carbohydrate-binding protein [Yeosuana sp. MJ-SS3]